MADETTGNGQEPEAISTPATPPPEDDFNKDAAEFVASTKKADRAPAPDPKQQIQETREQLDAVRQLGELRQWALDVQGERLARREREESEFIFAKGREMVAHFDHLPADFAERWLRAEYSIDPELHHAWDDRHESDDAMRWCQSCRAAEGFQSGPRRSQRQASL